MRCIFCKDNSEASASVEHILPESIGNLDYVLPKGWVCDCCNNYFSHAIEAPVLNSNYAKLARFEMAIPSKKGKIPTVKALHPQSRSLVDVTVDKSGNLTVSGDDEFSRSISSQAKGVIYIPASGEVPEPSYDLSRFMAKVALEVLAHKLVKVEGANKEIVDKRELDEIRNYVRRGKKGFNWPVHIRRIYRQEQTFFDELSNPDHQILNEFDLLLIPDENPSNGHEYYAVIVIFGVEYVVNIGGPELDGYLHWLEQNNNSSPLYLE